MATNWRAMLKGDVPELDLAQERQRILALIAADIAALQWMNGAWLKLPGASLAGN